MLNHRLYGGNEVEDSQSSADGGLLDMAKSLDLVPWMNGDYRVIDRRVI